MADPRDSFERGAAAKAPARGAGAGAKRPWIGVEFECTGVYVRVHRNAAATRYLARCPRCGAMVRFRVGTDGTEQRFFRVKC